ncbi:hypothetical protein IVB18_49220 (plasmid) [Bradyrhizobium sp. 186]|uniref:hypothetical protein n=1 Tax=Bradyrhizobium sp. 186 TaxID=2782654 RepID=UPI002000C8EC|nr:hypothetical protein [Bradyrhizobium sp. 186]UPK40918.1 hypothetical protein IVB18_49220 [Bradyrhizobium sp. 186]
MKGLLLLACILLGLLLLVLCGVPPWGIALIVFGLFFLLALQLLCLRASESMGNHDSNVVDAGRVG